MTKKDRKLSLAYDKSQVNEKRDFHVFAFDLCAGVAELPQTSGRPRLPVSDMIFCMLLKVYCLVSCRRFMSDLKLAYEGGFISRLPSYNSIFNYFAMPELRDYLVQLVIASSVVLKSIEKCFAIDSTGFSTSRLGLWIDHRYGKSKATNKRKFLKVHLMCGVLTNIVTAVEVTDGNAGDSPYFKPLFETTDQNFKVKKVCIDKAYLSRENLTFARSKDAMPFVPFKVDSKANDDPVWTRLFHFYSCNREWFEREYHKRSNAETTNAMIKMKFGERIRGRTEVPQVNELLCKVVCHNICVTIKSMYVLGIQPNFWDSEDKKAA